MLVTKQSKKQSKMFQLKMLKTCVLLILFLQKTHSINFKLLNYDEQTNQKIIINSSRIYKGESLFGSTLSPSSFSSIYLSMWVIFRTSNFPSTLYNLLEIKQNSDKLLTVQINPNIFLLKLFVLGNEFPMVGQGTVMNDKWILIAITLSNISKQLIGSFYFYNADVLPKQIAKSSYGAITYNGIFNKQSLQLEIGNYSFQQADGCLESFAFVDNLNFYWNSNTNGMNIDTEMEDYTAQTTELIWNYDFFYLRANPNNIFNLAKQVNQNINESLIKNSNILTLSAGSVFKTDYINPSENQGIIISFHFRIPSLSIPSDVILMKITNSDIVVSIDINGRINFLSQTLNGSFLGDWIQITIILKSVMSKRAYLYISQNGEIPTYFQTLQLGQLQFGDPSNSISIDFNHIRYYKGAFIYSDQGNCFLQASQDYPTCVLCKDAYSINYKDAFSCVTSNAPSKFIDYQTSTHCPKDMIYDQSGICVCLKQFYKTTDNKCARCPKYCDQCSSTNQCINQDIQRQSDGSCPNQYFDDGFSCIEISKKLSIQKKINLIGFFNSVSSVTFDNNQMQLPSQGPYSFFFNFSFLFSPSTASGNFAVINDQNNEIFTFYYEQSVSPSSLPLIKLQYLNQSIYNAYVHIDEAIWISFWTDMQQVFLLIQSFSKFFYKLIILPPQTPQIFLMNPSICVGSCSTGYLSLPAIRPFVFIQNMSNPSSDVKSLQQFLQLPLNRIAKFEMFPDSDLTKVYNNKITKNSNFKLEFNSLNVDLLNGFIFSPSSYASVQGFNLQFPISFYCIILPVAINQQVSLLRQELQNNVEYFLVPQGLKIFIRICYLSKCIDTKYAMLNLNESNNLFIFTRSYSPFSQTIQFIEFEVVCNYQREQIQFLNPYQATTQTQFNLKIGDQQLSTEDYLFYLNLINIDQGDGFYYFDYTKQEPCFIFSNIDKLKCIYNKYNLLQFNNNLQSTLITEQQCLNQSSEGYQAFANFQIRQCLLRCAEGYFKDNISKKCLKCLPKCKTCSGSRDNCTECKFSDQKIPSCDCTYPNFFLNEQNECQKCSVRCLSCSQSQNLCIECSAKRMNPPNCECDPFKFKETNDICVDIVSCNQNCKKCQYDQLTDQQICLKCQNGRINPPQCDCKPEYKSNSDGTCSPCLSSFYFDQSTQDCKPCSFPCQSCKNSQIQCTSCASGLLLKNDKCNCPYELQFYQSQQNSQQFLCLQPMNVKLTIQLKNSAYQVVFTFDKELKQIDFNQQKFGNLIQVMLTDVSKDLYSFHNPQINGNKLTINLEVLQSIKATLGIAIFLSPKDFVSSDEKYSLSQEYLKTPIQFQVGPYIFQENVFSHDLQQIVDKIKNSSNQNLLKLIQQMNFIFYILNTVQPSNLFILLNLRFPPNLFMFYQIVGSFIYPHLTDYMSTNFKQNYELFGHEFNQNEVHLVDQTLYQRLGFSNSFIVNAPIIIIKYVFLIVMIFIIQIFKALTKINKKKIHDNLKKLNQILIQRINAENEINLLITMFCIISQFSTFQQKLWPVRYGYYTAICILTLIIFSLYKNFTEINKLEEHDPTMFCYPLVKRLKEKHKKNSVIGKNYFFIQYLKKYFVLIILFAFQNSPIVACTFNGVIFLISAFMTFRYKPYLNKANRIIKISSEICFSAVLFLHISIAFIEQQLDKQPQFDQETIQTYLNIGQAIIIFLLIFNLIFLSEYIVLIYSYIVKIYKKKKNQIKPKSQNSNIQFSDKDTNNQSPIKYFKFQNNSKQQQQYLKRIIPNKINQY